MGTGPNQIDPPTQVDTGQRRGPSERKNCDNQCYADEGGHNWNLEQRECQKNMETKLSSALFSYLACTWARAPVA